MVISKSIKKKKEKEKQKWIAGAFVFSGRPDPTWPVNNKLIKQLEKIWNSLEPLTDKYPSPSILGYRGCFVRNNVDREWFAYGGVVIFKRDNRSESRLDRQSTFEKSVLSSAPPNLLPSYLVQIRKS
jgi:hypothetical protein